MCGNEETCVRSIDICRVLKHSIMHHRKLYFSQFEILQERNC